MGTSNLEIVLTATDRASGTLKGLSGTLGNIGQNLTKVGGAMTVGITAPIVALGTLAVMSASDYEEAANKVMVVFGEAARGVNAFADDASFALGMSSAQALEAAGTYGNLFTAMGIGQEDAAGMSIELLQLAADLASFNNIDPTEALNKLRAGLTGETEPLKTLGVNLSAAGIELKAIELGLIASGEELDASSKAQAAYALIMEQTTNAQGDFARTSEGLANTTRIVKAQFAEVAAELGAVLLPIVSQLASFLKTLMERFQGLTPEQKKMIVVVAGIAAVMGPLLIVVGTLISALGAIIPVIGAVVGVLSGPVLLVIGLVVGAIALLALAWKNNWGDIQGKTHAVVDWLRDKIGVFIEWMRAFWDEHGEKILAVVNALWDGVMKVFTYYKEQIQRVFELFRLAFEGDWEGFGKKLREIWDEAWEFIKKAFVIIGETLKTMAFNLGVAIGQKIRDIDWMQVGKDVITGIINGLRAFEGWLGRTAVDIAQGLFDVFKGFFGISSPSRLMEQMIGANIGAGIQSGLMNSIRDLSMNVTAGLPSLAGGIVSNQSAYAGAGGGSRNINIYFQGPVYADEYELERLILPIVERGIREDQARN